MDEMKRDYGIVVGGQGKPSRETEDAGFWFAMCMLAFLGILSLALLGWARESERGQPEVRFVQPEERY